MNIADGLLLLCTWFTIFTAAGASITQAVTYPLFALVGKEEFPRYHATYNRWIAPVIIAPAFLSIGTAFALLFIQPSGVPAWALWSSGLLALVNLIVTVGITVPLHAELQRVGKSEALIRRLVLVNWPRAIAFSIHGVLLLWLLTQVF